MGQRHSALPRTGTLSRPARSYSGLALVLLAIAMAAPVREIRAQAANPPEVAQACVACHGEKPMNGAPPIAGQNSNFLQWQLVFFRSGQRHNEIMQGMAGSLSNDDIRKAAGYFASLPPPRLSAPSDSQAELTHAGSELAAQRHCAACHGDNYMGQQAAPRVAGQPEAYLAKALSDYRSSARPSSGGSAMTEVAGTLSDKDITALAHYLAVKS